MANLKFYNNSSGQWEEIKVSTKFKDIRNTVVLTSDSTYVNLGTGFSSFNPEEDVLFVFLNSTYIEEDKEYTINGGLLRIEAMNGEIWANGTTFNFVALKNVDKNALPSADGSLIQDGTLALPKFASSIQTLINKIGNEALTTTAQDLSGAVNEVVDKIGVLNTLNTTNKTDLVSAINEHGTQLDNKIKQIKESSRNGFLKGMVIAIRNITFYNRYMSTDNGLGFVQRLVDAGVNYVSIIVPIHYATGTLYCDGDHDTTVNAVTRIQTIYNLLKNAGFIVGLKIHEEGSYGNVSDTTFITYLSESYVTQHKAIVDAIMLACPNIDYLTIMNERPTITGTGTSVSFVIELLQYYKSTYPSIQLGVSAVPNEVLQNSCAIKDYVDFFGINVYPRVEGKDIASYSDFRQNVGHLNEICISEAMANMYKITGKKYIITEAGCPPFYGSPRYPDAYAYINGSTQRVESNNMNFTRAMYNHYVSDENCVGIQLFNYMNDATDIFDCLTDDTLFNNIKEFYGGI